MAQKARVERLTTFVIDVPTTDAEEQAAYELVRPEPKDLEDFHRTDPKGFTARKRDVLTGRLDGEEGVWLVRDGQGNWVGWCHLVRGAGPNSRIRHTLKLTPDEVYLFDDGTTPANRRRGVHQFTIRARLAIARAAGARRAVTTITNSNTASITSYRRLGFRPRSQLLFFPALGRTIELPLTPTWIRRVGRAWRR